jgi:chromosome segregation ATPase
MVEHQAVVQVNAPSRKAELREKIRALETEKTQLEKEIVFLKDELEVIDLERRSSSLVNEVENLQIEKTLLEEKVSSSSASSSPEETARDELQQELSEFEEVSTKLAEATSEIEASVEMVASSSENAEPQVVAPEIAASGATAATNEETTSTEN